MADVTFTCVSCNQLISNNDWSQNNITNTPRGLLHKTCKIQPTSNLTFQISHDFDQNGILYWLGTHKNTKKLYTNPAITMAVSVKSSSIHKDSNHPHALTGRKNSACFTQNVKDSWFMIDLKDTKVIPTHYSLKYTPEGAPPIVVDPIPFTNPITPKRIGAVRYWVLYGSNNSTNGIDGEWTLLSQHANDTKLNVNGGTWTWLIPQKNKNKDSFSQFKILQYHTNSNGTHILSLSNFELYGTVIVDQKNKPIENVENIQKTDDKKINEPEQLKLVNNLISENNRLKREYDEYKQLCEAKETSLIETITENNKMKQTYKAMEISFNSKIMEKENDIKQLQASLFSSYSQNTIVTKEYKSQLQQNEQVMIVLRNENRELKMRLKNKENKDNEEEKKMNSNDNIIINMDKCKLKFADWLCNIVKLPQYLTVFKQNECDDIRMIEFLDENTIKNEIGINKSIHCKLLLKKVNEFKVLQMEFNQLFETHKSLKQCKQIFEMNAIVTLQDLKNKMQNKRDLEMILLEVKDKNIIDLMWSIIHSQIPQQKPNNEGNETLYM